MTVDRTALGELTLALLAARAPGATICPSEVALASVVAAQGSEGAAKSWRKLMPEVHAAIDRLLAERLVQLSWKGAPLAKRTGPYRISRSAGNLSA